jgi:type I restriction enzyme S subunit
MIKDTSTKTKPFYNTTIPYDWEVKTLREIGRIVTGNTPSRTENKYWGGNYCWATAQDFGDKYIYNTIEKVSDDARSKDKVKNLD